MGTIQPLHTSCFKVTTWWRKTCRGVTTRRYGTRTIFYAEWRTTMIIFAFASRVASGLGAVDVLLYAGRLLGIRERHHDNGRVGAVLEQVLDGVAEERPTRHSPDRRADDDQIRLGLG